MCAYVYAHTYIFIINYAYKGAFTYGHWGKDQGEH